MEVIIRLNNQTAGKDKIARLIQYLSRAIYDSIQHTEGNLELIETFKNIEYALSSFRKLLRFGKCIDVFYSCFVSIHYQNIALRVTLTLSRISQALFLFADHFVWLARAGLVRDTNLKKWNQLANKYWIFSIIMNLARDFYEIARLMDINLKAKSCQKNSFKDFNKTFRKSYVCLYEHRSIVLDTIKNSCDFFIPLTALGYTKMNSNTIGFLGVLSSLAGLYVILQPEFKLSPL